MRVTILRKGRGEGRQELASNKLAIGRELRTNPKPLVVDEATEGLVALVRAEIWACLTQT